MIDGRFDQHFLEIFAEAEVQAREGDRVPWLSLVTALAACVLLGITAILLG